MNRINMANGFSPNKDHFDNLQDNVDNALSSVFKSLMIKGVTEGFSVILDDTKGAIVQPGTAYDNTGKNIILKEEIDVSLNDIARPSTGNSRWISLAVVYDSEDQGEIIDISQNSVPLYTNDACNLFIVDNAIEGTDVNSLLKPTIPENYVLLLDILLTSGDTYSSLITSVERHIDISSYYGRIIATVPGVYEVSDGWSRIDGDVLKSPTRVAIEINNTGVVGFDSLGVDLNSADVWDVEQVSDYTVKTNRVGRWFYIHAYHENTIVRYKISEFVELHSQAVGDSRLIEKFYCLAGDLLNYVGEDLSATATPGDVDTSSYLTMTSRGLTILTGDTFPSVSETSVFFWKNDENIGYISDGTKWIKFGWDAFYDLEVVDAVEGDTINLTKQTTLIQTDNTSADINFSIGSMLRDGQEVYIAPKGGYATFVTIPEWTEQLEASEEGAFSGVVTQGATTLTSVGGGGSGGVSVSEYDCNLAIDDSSRKVIAINNDGDIAFASKIDWELINQVGVNSYNVLGFANDTKSPKDDSFSNRVVVQKVGLLSGFTGLIKGQPVYVSTAGDLTQDIDTIVANQWRIMVGYAVSATQIDIHLTEPILNTLSPEVRDFIPIGTEFTVLNGIVPTGSMLANGQELLRVNYPVYHEMCQRAGYPDGDGDGVNTFNLPNRMVDGLENICVKVRYISGNTYEEHEQLDSRLLSLEDLSDDTVSRMTTAEARLDDKDTVDAEHDTRITAVENTGLTRVFEGNNPKMTDIDPLTQELFLDGTDSLITSSGRKPIENMNGGTYIPPLVNIDGKMYPNPSWCDIDPVTGLAVAKERGTYGFFEPWENITWDDVSDWAPSNGMSVDKINDWLIVSSIDVEYGYIRVGTVPTEIVLNTVLLKRGTSSIVFLGTSNNILENAIFRWDGNHEDGEKTKIERVVFLSTDLALITFRGTALQVRFTIRLYQPDDTVYFKDIQSTQKNFIPPFGQDGNSQVPSLAYPFDKWDHPISFTFKPQFDYNTSSWCDIITNHDKNGDRDTYIAYNPVSNRIRLLGNCSDGVEDAIEIYHNGTIWVNGSDGGGFTSNENLQVEIDVIMYIDTAHNLKRYWFDGCYFEKSIDSDYKPRPWISIGSDAIRDNYYANALISNFMVHPKDANLAEIVGMQYKNPNALYFKGGANKLDPFSAKQSSGHGGLVKKGYNINGHYRIYEDGYKECWGSNVSNISIAHGALGGVRSSGGAIVITYPIPFGDKPLVLLTPKDNSVMTISEANGSTNTELSPLLWAVTSQVATERTIRWKASGY